MNLGCTQVHDGITGISIAQVCPHCLDLLGAPAGIGLAHVAGGLDRGNKFEDDVCDTNDANNGTRDVLKDPRAQDEGAQEDVDCHPLSGLKAKEVASQMHLRKPRPMKEKRNEA